MVAGEGLMKIANEEYDLQRYSPDLWRTIAEVNGIQNPLTFGQEFLGKGIRIPVPRGLVQAVVNDWMTKTNAEVKNCWGISGKRPGTVRGLTARLGSHVYL